VRAGNGRGAAGERLCDPRESLVQLDLNARKAVGVGAPEARAPRGAAGGADQEGGGDARGRRSREGSADV
jgi:hypothetical protein